MRASAEGNHMPYAAMIEVDNRGEDPDDGRRGLREELAPAMTALPGFNSALFMTAYERGRGVAVVVFDTQDQAEHLASGVTIGQQIRDGVSVTGTEVLEVSASANTERMSSRHGNQSQSS
jgi:hypothetical protein